MRSIQRLGPLRATAFGLLITLVAACGGASESSTTSTEMPDSITIGQYTLANPYGIAIEKGWFEEELGDTEVEFVELDGTSAALAGLASGDLDVALIGTPGAATATSQGIPIKVVWIYDVIGAAEKLVVRPDSGIETVADLQGKSIAIPFGSTGQFSLVSLLELNGMTENDIDMVDLDVSAATAAFHRGDIDGFWVAEPTATELVEQADGQILTTNADLIEDGVITADVAAANDDFASTYPAALSAYLKVLDRATRAFLDDKAGSYDVMADYVGLSPDEVKTIMDGYQFLTAEEQATEEWLGGGLATAIASNAVLWERLDRIQEAASEDDIRSSVTGEFLSPYEATTSQD